MRKGICGKGTHAPKHANTTMQTPYAVVGYTQPHPGLTPPGMWQTQQPGGVGVSPPRLAFAEVGARAGSQEAKTTVGQHVYEFREISYTVGKGDKAKHILTGVSATVRSGQVFFPACIPFPPMSSA